MSKVQQTKTKRTKRPQIGPAMTAFLAAFNALGGVAKKLKAAKGDDGAARMAQAMGDFLGVFSTAVAEMLEHRTGDADAIEGLLRRMMRVCWAALPQDHDEAPSVQQRLDLGYMGIKELASFLGATTVTDESRGHAELARILGLYLARFVEVTEKVAAETGDIDAIVTAYTDAMIGLKAIEDRSSAWAVLFAKGKAGPSADAQVSS